MQRLQRLVLAAVLTSLASPSEAAVIQVLENEGADHCEVFEMSHGLPMLNRCNLYRFDNGMTTNAAWFQSFDGFNSAYTENNDMQFDSATVPFDLLTVQGNFASHVAGIGAFSVRSPKGGLVTMFPEKNADGFCLDAPFTLTFSGPEWEDLNRVFIRSFSSGCHERQLSPGVHIQSITIAFPEPPLLALSLVALSAFVLSLVARRRGADTKLQSGPNLGGQ